MMHERRASICTSLVHKSHSSSSVMIVRTNWAACEAPGAYGTFVAGRDD